MNGSVPRRGLRIEIGGVAAPGLFGEGRRWRNQRALQTHRSENPMPHAAITAEIIWKAKRIRISLGIGTAPHWTDATSVTEGERGQNYFRLADNPRTWRYRLRDFVGFVVTSQTARVPNIPES